MAIYSGKEGVVKVAGGSAATVTKVTEFSIDEKSETARIDAAGEDWHDHMEVKASYSGKMTLRRNDADTAGQGVFDRGAAVQFELYPDGNVAGRAKLTGTLFVDSRSDGFNHDDPNEISISFLGKGALVRGVVAP